MIAENIIWNLDKVLENKKMSKYELSAKTGLSQPTIYNLEKQKDLHFSTIILICQALEVQPNQIVKIKIK